MFDHLKRFLKRLFSKPKPKVYAEVKNWPEGWEHHPPPKPAEPTPDDFALKWWRHERQVKEARRENNKS